MSGSEWWRRSIFYHIYTLGFCGAPERNDFSSPAEARLEAVAEAADHIRGLGCNAVYLGPLFESTSHGYDTVDHYHVDRRLGDNDTLCRLVRHLHERGLRVVLDGVFNHTARDHFAFYDLRQRGEASPYRNWFKDVDFSGDNRFGDGFIYRAWEGHEELPELNLENREVREHLFGTVAQMIELFEIDGLRLDVAYALPPDFLRELAEFVSTRRADFFLLGEMIHGDYGRFAAETGLHSITNYESYKALWSAHNDGNYFELAHSLQRNFGSADHGGRSRAGCGPWLYNFADNHDVDRVASKLEDPRHLFPLYALLFTIPGIPSVYYGSEFGIVGRRGRHSDEALRPDWSAVLRRLNVEGGVADVTSASTTTELSAFIAELAGLRRRSVALHSGGYRQLYLDHKTMVFERANKNEQVLVAVNACSEPATVSVPVEELKGAGPVGLEENKSAEDLFQPGHLIPVKEAGIEIELPAYGTAVLAY